MPRISTVPSAISLTSNSKRRRTKFGWLRNDDLRTTDTIFDCDALPLRHDCFEFSKVENHIRPVEASHCAAHDFAGPILELFVNHFLLDLTNPLYHRLLGRLRGDPTKISRRHFHFDGVSNVGVRLDLTRF